MHKSVRGIIKYKDGIILIHRIKKQDNGNIRDYYVVPGGKMEKEESENQTVIREVYEELGIDIKPIKKILEVNSEYDDSIQIFYLCDFISGILGTGDGPEFHNMDEYKGKFEIEIVGQDKIKNINLVPEEIKDFIVKGGLM